MGFRNSVLFFGLVAGVAASASNGTAISDDLAEWGLRQHFELFIDRFDKDYTQVEKDERFWIFVSNLEDAVAKNRDLEARGLDAAFGITKFSDWTQDEFKARMGLRERDIVSFIPLFADKAEVQAATQDAPAKVDWRDKGVVTPVKDQKQCGSCWAHSAVETLESQYAINTGNLTSLSVQQVVSCDTSDDGCGGGWYYTAWTDYIEKVAGGLTTEASYPYDESTAEGKATKCLETKVTAGPLDVLKGTDVSSFAWATAPCQKIFCRKQDEETLKANLAEHGPVSIAVDASHFNSYTNGVLTSASCKSGGASLDHAVQVVGYDTTAPTPYWIVRNSWGTDWGNDGYVYLAMGSNTCGIADKAALVTLASN